MSKDWHDSVTKFGFPYTKKETKYYIWRTIMGFAALIAATAVFCLVVFSGIQGIVSAMLPLVFLCGIEFIIGVFVVLCIWANRKK